MEPVAGMIQSNAGASDSAGLARRTVLRRAALGAGAASAALTAPRVVELSLAPQFAAAASGIQEAFVDLGPVGAVRAFGSISVIFDLVVGRVCWEITSLNLLPDSEFLSLHIHAGPADDTGPTAISLANELSGCVSAPRPAIEAVIDDPENFYVIVHTQSPGNDIRGQVGSTSPAAR